MSLSNTTFLQRVSTFFFGDHNHEDAHNGVPINGNGKSASTNGKQVLGHLYSTDKEWQGLHISKLAKAELETLQTLVPLNKLCNYKVIFEGDDVEDKASAAALLAKEEGRQVFHINLAQVTSKYIGETEKNLSAVFEKAQTNDWILFFDEADALFGKRTSVQDAHDKYANQAVSYLLQKIEEYKGIVIIAPKGTPSEEDELMRKVQAVITFKKQRADAEQKKDPVLSR